MAQPGAGDTTPDGADHARGRGQASAQPSVTVATPRPVTAAPAGTRQMELASWQRRMAGYVIDSLIIFALTSALWVRLFVVLTSQPGGTPHGHQHARTPAVHAAIASPYAQMPGTVLIELITMVALAVLYYSLLTSAWGATIGKRCVSTRVASAVNGTRPGNRACFVRAVVFAVGVLILPFFIADSSWLLAGERRQCLHDKAAGTVVVRIRRIRTHDRPAAAGVQASPVPAESVSAPIPMR